ncbi:HAD family hydrolase [Alkalihalobacterium elongatum]|uniref:HAD family hydrolase n=1 Tax=Alkalihalobacterium elongatum TaxID=2675466 RepID=UPI001C1F5A06|nr:HAD family hydrolase [Alkalihalobacterium elongatum]
MKPKVIIIDLDGTLLNSSKTISMKSIEVLKGLKANGIHLIFATARPPRCTNFKELNLASIGTMVYYNGALFHCSQTNKQIHFSIPKKKTKELIDFCLFLDNAANISIEVKDKWYSSKSLDYTDMMKVEQNPTIISYEELIGYDCTKVLLTNFSQSEQLLNKFGKELNILITDHGELIQIMSQKSSKESAVEYILDQLQLTFHDAMCFGDDFNDLGLFQACGYSIAMGNAIKELKEIADNITETNDNDGVAIVLEKYSNRMQVSH